MKIVIDAFGGDNAPDAVIRGSVEAVSEFNAEIILTGSEKEIKARFSALNLPFNGISICPADGVISVHDNPLDIRKSKANTSMGKAFQLVSAGEADAFVSAGSTAALVVGGTMITGRLKGVKRPALATIMPSSDGFYLFLDSGANLECRPEMLLQFAVMGSIYVEKILGIKSPRVGLLNVGTEEEKGRVLEQESLVVLKNAPINFIGNVEGRDPILGMCDVVVTDGFTGNIYLKAVEGMGKLFKISLNNIFRRNIASKIGYLLSKSGVNNVAKQLDYREVGGSPLLGSAKPIFKAHGSSDARAIKNAVKRAMSFVENNVNSEIEKSLAEIIKAETNQKG